MRVSVLSIPKRGAAAPPETGSANHHLGAITDYTLSLARECNADIGGKVTSSCYCLKKHTYLNVLVNIPHVFSNIFMEGVSGWDHRCLNRTVTEKNEEIRKPSRPSRLGHDRGNEVMLTSDNNGAVAACIYNAEVKLTRGRLHHQLPAEAVPWVAFGS